MTHYLDASVLVPMVVIESSSQRIDDFIADANTDPVVSMFALAEVAAALSRLVRMRELDLNLARQRLADLDDWHETNARLLDVDSVDVRLTNNLVRRFDLKLRTPDALHLAICRRHAFTLATLDLRLATAAHTLGVAVALP